MLTTRLRQQIEWHFYNHAADLALYSSKAQDIIESGLTVNFSRIGSRGRGNASQTESKALRLEALGHERNWATVVQNTFTVFRFEPEYEIMDELYIQGKRLKSIIRSKKNKDGLNESTFWYWRDRWLTTALMWAKEFELL